MISMIVSALIFAAALPVRHDVDDTEYHGNPADYPAVFALYRTSAGAPECMATLIARQWAITVAHCTRENALLDGVASTPGYAVEIAGAPAAVTAVFHHMTGDGSQGADLALLRLDAPVDHVEPERLYRNADELHRTIIMPGWGDTGNGLIGITGGDGVFRVGENRIDGAHEGWLIWRFDDPRSEVQNALALEAISGPGDSGGPGFVITPHGRFIAGVSSRQLTFGRPEGVYGAEEYFVRVSWYAEWIDSIMAAGE